MHNVIIELYYWMVLLTKCFWIKHAIYIHVKNSSCVKITQGKEFFLYIRFVCSSLVAKTAADLKATAIYSTVPTW